MKDTRHKARCKECDKVLGAFEAAHAHETGGKCNTCASIPRCAKCGHYMNPIVKVMGDICGSCVRKIHREVGG